MDFSSGTSILSRKLAAGLQYAVARYMYLGTLPARCSGRALLQREVPVGVALLTVLGVLVDFTFWGCWKRRR